MNHDLIQQLSEILLRGAVLLPACLLIALLLRRGSASLIRRFWRCSLLALLIASTLTLAPPLLTFTSNNTLLPSTSQPPRATAGSATAATINGAPAASLESVLGLPDASLLTTPSPGSSATPPPSFRITWPLALAALWLLGALLFAARKLLGTIGVHRLRRTASPVDHEGWQRDLAELRESCGVKQPVTLCHHLVLRSPIVTGMRQPAILLPRNFADYSADDRRAVLLHELAHVRNRDAFFRWIASIIRILHWPNPFVWLAERSMRLAEERASDDAVLKGGISAPSYAELLAKLASGGAPLIGESATPGGSAMAQPRTLLPRVHAILRPSQARRNPGRAASLTLATLTITLAVLAGGSAIVGADPKDKPTAKTVALPANKPAPPRGIDHKLDSIIIPTVSFQDTTLEEALEFIRMRSQQLDQGPGARGINIINKLSQHSAPEVAEDEGLAPAPRHLPMPTLSLNLERVPVRALLDYLCEVTATSYRTTEYAVVISPLSNGGEDILSVNFHIPAEILEAELKKSAQVRFSTRNDPFAAEGPPDDGEPKFRSLTALEWLKEQGVAFGPGCSAFYTRAVGTLMVRNTPTHLDFVSHIIDSLNGRPSRAGMTPDAAARLGQVKGALQSIVIPELDFQQATLAEALEFLRQKAKELSSDEKGFNPVQFVVLHDSSTLNSTVTLKLRQIPLGVAIKHIVDLAEMQSTVGAYGIEIRPRYSQSDSFHLATYHLSPENMERVTNSIAEISPHPLPSEIFRKVGVEYPPGAALFWNSNSGHLIVRNTLTNLNQIETFLEGLNPPDRE